VVAAVLISLVCLDDFVGTFSYRTGTKARIEVIPARDQPTQRAIVILPGYMMSGTIVAKAFSPFVSKHDALIGVDYAARGVNTEDIYQQVLKALYSVRPSRVVLFGASMGGMVAMDLLANYEEDGAPFGKVSIVFDTAPAGSSDIKRPPWLLDVGCWYRGGPISSSIWAVISSAMSQPTPESIANPGLMAAARHSGAWVGMPAITTEACFIRRFSQPIGAVNLRRSIRQVLYLHGSQPQDDPLVDIDSSIKRLRTFFPDLRVVTIPRRLGQWHLPLVERPQEAVLAFIAAT